MAELYVRRCGELGEQQWWCVDACDAVAAEVSAAQNISHARAVGQMQFACALWHRLPAVARVFSSGVIDFRVVSTIVSRTENVEDDVMAQLDDAIARHAEKWMKLSGPKLRDRVDLWVTKFDPAGVRVPPKVNDNQYVDLCPASPGMAGLSGYLRAGAPPYPQARDLPSIPRGSKTGIRRREALQPGINAHPALSLPRQQDPHTLEPISRPCVTYGEPDAVKVARPVRGRGRGK
ncbi:MAG: DUF222 domain-containing protein [Mycobacterium sp.]|uniref:DUF222 domain-containing protein n=1 Tax=Mycobacterium sp. TaxID=1785 RepID=UPI00389A3A45